MVDDAVYYSKHYTDYDDDNDSISSGGGGDGGDGGDARRRQSYPSTLLDDDEDYDDDGDINFLTSNNNRGLDNNDILSPAAANNGEGVDFDDSAIASLPRILLMGPHRSGKTSIQRVVFHKMSPHETLFRLEATQTLERAVVDHTPLCRFTIWDFPGEQYDYGYSSNSNSNNSGVGAPPQSMLDDGIHSNPTGDDDIQQQQHKQQQQLQQQHDDHIFTMATALIFVLDAQDEPYDHVLQSFTDTVTRAIRANPNIAIEVFVHKVDGELFLSDEAKYDCRRDVMQQVSDELSDAGLSHDAIPISYHLTSIYDHSVFEALSRVVQRLIPELPTLEHLLNVLVGTCSMEKAYLFDVASKLYIATDSSPVDMQSVELCSDMIDVVLDVSGIYGAWGVWRQHRAAAAAAASSTTAITTTTTKTNRRGSGILSSIENIEDEDEEDIASCCDDEVPTAGGVRCSGDGNVDGGMIASSTKDDDDIGNNNSDEDDEEEDELLGKVVGHNSSHTLTIDDDITDGAAYDADSASTIHLSNGMVLYLKEVDTMLALVCLTRAENFRKKSLINYNIGCLKKALMALPQSVAAATAAAQDVVVGGGIL